MQFAMDFQPTNPCEEAGAALVQDDRYHYTFTVGLKNGSRVLTLTEVKNHVRTVLAETPLEKDGRIYLTVAPSFLLTVIFSQYYGPELSFSG